MYCQEVFTKISLCLYFQYLHKTLCDWYEKAKINKKNL